MTHDPIEFNAILARVHDAMKQQLPEELAAAYEQISELAGNLEHVTELLVDTWATAMQGDPEQEYAVVLARAALNDEVSA